MPGVPRVGDTIRILSAAGQDAIGTVERVEWILFSEDHQGKEDRAVAEVAAIWRFDEDAPTFPSHPDLGSVSRAASPPRVVKGSALRRAERLSRPEARIERLPE